MLRPTRGTELDLVAVAKRQKELLWLILLGVALYAATLGLAAAAPVGVGLAVLLQLLAQIAWIVQIVRLFAAMRTSLLLRLVYIVLLFIPLISLIVVLLASAQATSMLRASGARVGLMGVPKEDYNRLRKGFCRGCGYDRSGLEMLQACPECGRVPQVV